MAFLNNLIVTGSATFHNDINGNLNGNATSAATLTTSRTIFGKSFNGSANVSGQPLVYGTYQATASQRYSYSGIQVRENGLVGSAQTDIGYAPSIGFHWSGKTAGILLYHSDGNFYLRKQDGTTRASLDANIIGNASTATSATSLTGFKATSTTNLGIDRTDVNQAIGYVSGLTQANWNYQQVDGALYSQVYNASYQHQIFADYRTGQISVRGKNNGTWQSWRRILDESNYKNICTTISIGSASGWSAGTLPTLGTAIAADDITAWSAGTLPALTASEGVIKLSKGTLPSLSYTARSIPNVTAVGTLPSLTVTTTKVLEGKTT